MKKLACLFLANIIFLGVFMQNVQAEDINFCENCGAELETYAGQPGHWETGVPGIGQSWTGIRHEHFRRR